MQLSYGVTHVEQRQQTGRMPGGSRRELGAFQQHRVSPAFQRQMVQRADAYHAAADHHDAGMSFHEIDLPTQMRPAV